MARLSRVLYLLLITTISASALGLASEDPESCLLHAYESEIPDPKLGWIEFYRPVTKSAALDVDYYARLHHSGNQITFECRRNKNSIACKSPGPLFDCTLLAPGAIECSFIGTHRDLGSKITCVTAQKDDQ